MIISGDDGIHREPRTIVIIVIALCLGRLGRWRCKRPPRVRVFRRIAQGMDDLVEQVPQEMRLMGRVGMEVKSGHGTRPNIPV
jgi:hypothetical protein